MIELANEAVTSTFGLSQILELGVILSTIILTLATVGLWYSTAQVHKDEVMKLTNELGNANDNMTDVARDEIAANHAERMAQLRRVQRKGHKR